MPERQPLLRLRPLLAAVVLSAASLSALFGPSAAEACGGFFRRKTTTATIPSLEVEQVLIVHDPAKEEEHFVREIVFRDAKEPFGFVVPTPSQPKVAKVDKSPFVSLASRFPPEPPEGLGLGFGSGFGRMGGGGGAAPPQKVTVLSQERVGSFTAFVLSATDAAALKSWLDENQLETTPQSEAWLKHYTDLGFFFVAFRYELPTGEAAKATTRSETVRISFQTPLPFYPYLEPEHPDDKGRPYRVLAVWLASTRRHVPVATVADGSSLQWKRPWKEARKHPRASLADLRGALGGPLAQLLPPGLPPADDEPVSAPGRRNEPDEKRLVLQTFEDQKPSRRGWGDVVLVPDSPEPADAQRLGRMRKLMASLDPGVSP